MMKRKKPLRRRKPLRVRSSHKFEPAPLRRQWMKRQPRRTGWVKGRYVATVSEWQNLLRLKLGPCRVCGATQRASIHHVVERDDFGGDVIENLIPLCGDGTTGCHGIYTTRAAGLSLDGQIRTWSEVADGIRRTFLPDELEYVITNAGEYYLERRYPLTDSA